MEPIDRVSRERLELNSAALLLPMLGALHWIALQLKALTVESALHVNKTIVENIRATIQQHSEGSRVADLQRSVRRSLDLKS